MPALAWLTRSGLDPGTRRAPGEIVALRLIALGIFSFYAIVAFVSDPGAGLTGDGLPILVGTLLFLGLAFWVVPFARSRPQRRLGGIVGMTVVAAVLVQLQPDGVWAITPYLVASVGALMLPVRTGAVVFVACTAAILGSAVVAGRGDSAVGILVGVVPWFLFMRVMRRVREEHEVTKGLLRELEASRAAEAVAAAENERARVAREMHDVLAHSLSSLALQLESTRLLAVDRGTDHEVTDAIARAHGIAGTGLDEARRAIGALRGDDLPGPDRLPELVDAFTSAGDVPCTLTVTGSPRPLAGDARLALYRTAQEALTNVRRHADAVGAEVRLDWEPAAVRLVVADRSRRLAPVGAGARVGTGGRADAGPAAPGADVRSRPAAGGGYGLTGMRERAELLGGTLTAGPTGDGFRVVLELPA